jgi:nucleolar MIF4G domain-containing protein 1
LIYDVLKFLGESFGDKDVELILAILKSVGFRLRKDDPASLKSFIILLQQKAGKAKSGSR